MSLIAKETNSYAFRNNKAANPWKTLSIQELYHFLGCLIKLGLFKHPPRSYSWSFNGCLTQVPLSKNRFESILCNFHFKDRGLNPIQGNWWDKLEPIFSILRQKCSFYWIPSTNLTVDEIMLKFEGRSSQKITIPGKPIPTGFKLFALGDSGYTYNWECTRPGLAEGALIGKQQISVKIPNSTISTFFKSYAICGYSFNSMFVYLYSKRVIISFIS
jgi:Transposase IS4